MSERDEAVSLSNIGGGAALEMFDLELCKVLENIADPNTDRKAVRTITMQVKIKPNEERDIGQVAIFCSSRTSNPKPFETMIYMGEKDGIRFALESRPPAQKTLFDQKELKKLAIIGGNQ